MYHPRSCTKSDVPFRFLHFCGTKFSNIIPFMTLHVPYKFGVSISSILEFIRILIPKAVKVCVPFPSFHFCEIIAHTFFLTTHNFFLTTHFQVGISLQKNLIHYLIFGTPE